MRLVLTEPNHDRLMRHLYAREEELTRELADVQDRIETAKKYKSIFDAWSVEKSHESADENGKHGHLGPQDIAYCTTQHEALKQIARLSGGLVNPTEAASIVLDAGLSQGKKSSVVSTLSGYTSNEDVWEWVDAGLYRLREFATGEGAESALDSPDPLASPAPPDAEVSAASVQGNHANKSPWGDLNAADASQDMAEAA